MLSVHESESLTQAGRELLEFVLSPQNWVLLEGLKNAPHLRPGQNAEYQREVGPLRVCASVDVTKGLEAYLRIGFRAPNLTPNRAADHLESFLSNRIPLVPNAEWQVQVDGKGWIHFIRRYAGQALDA